MTTRPRLAIIAYGSLLNPSTLEDLFEDVQSRIVPVRVRGFRRICNQEANWRPVTDDQRAVLNVERAPGSWFNGLLVTDISREGFETFRDRERGYRLLEVESDQLERYEADAVATDRLETEQPERPAPDVTLMPTGKHPDPDIAPIESYLQRCLDGARAWSETFLADFKRTTELNSGVNLHTYLDD